MTLPLAGIRVVELTCALSGPFCSMILADLGADVIKVEPTPSGDMIRTWGSFDQGISAYYLSTNRNKRGLELIRDMFSQVDIVVENFKSGVMEDMGLGYESLSKANSRLILGSITGFGADGPMGSWQGIAMIPLGIPAGPINNLSDVFSDPQVHHCRLAEEIQRPLLGTLKQVANPIKLDGLKDGSVRLPSPLFGNIPAKCLPSLAIRTRISSNCLMTVSLHNFKR